MSLIETSEARACLHGTIERRVRRTGRRNEVDCILTAEGEVRHRVIGPDSLLIAGRSVWLTGVWAHSDDETPVFHAASLAHPTVATVAEDYLATRLPRLTDGACGTLSSRAGEQTCDVSMNLSSRPHVQEGVAKDLRDEQCAAAIRATQSLHSSELSRKQAAPVVETYGSDGVRIVRADPSHLARRPPGFGLKTADRVAAQVGLDHANSRRIDAAIKVLLNQRLRAGHCGVDRDWIIENGARLQALPAKIIAERVSWLCARGFLREHEGRGGHHLFLPHLHQAETRIALKMRRLAGAIPPWGRISTQDILAAADELHLTLTTEQLPAIEGVMAHAVSILTGGPGCGKTTCARVLSHLIDSRISCFSQNTPTHSAGRRLQEATGKPTSTLHNLLKGAPGRERFGHHADNRLAEAAVLVDEVSMVDVFLMDALLDALSDEAGLILLGDPQQLPSVGPGDVLRDLIDSGVVPTFQLKQSRRHVDAPAIAEAAAAVLSGAMPTMSARGKAGYHFIPMNDRESTLVRIADLVSRELPMRFGFDPQCDIQVLSPMHRGVLGCQSINRTIQRRLNPGAANSNEDELQSFHPGDRVIQCETDKENDLCKGDIGRVSTVSQGETVVKFSDRVVRYPDHRLTQLALGYATTVHRAQGNEFRAVVVVLAPEHALLLNQRTLNTAITRAREVVVVVGARRALERALEHRPAERRQTGLADRLRSVQ